MVSDNDDGDDDDEYKRAGYMLMMMTILPSPSSPFFTGRWVKQKKIKANFGNFEPLIQECDRD